MTPKYLLDTNVCIVYIKFPNSNVLSRIAATPAEEIAVCSVVKYEMFFGSMRSSDPVRSLQIQEAFLEQFESLPFDDTACRHAAKIRADLSRTGTIIGAYDILIAATALANDLTLVTHNVKEFGRVNGLRIEDWE
ncbi:MAG: type II toxin-antitoxin system VapC family toxin [Acidobacteria bacterium]|nr:type II toxin-antitoxin system VapC family toxin [Acidobacteriota bacterium]